MLSQNLWRWTWDFIFKSSSGDSFELVRCENLWPRLILQSNVLCCWWLIEGLWPCIESSSLYMMMFWIEGWNNDDEICGVCVCVCVCVCVQREKTRGWGCCWLTGCRVWCWVWDLIYEAQRVPSGYSKRQQLLLPTVNSQHFLRWCCHPYTTWTLSSDDWARNRQASEPAMRLSGMRTLSNKYAHWPPNQIWV